MVLLHCPVPFWIIWGQTFTSDVFVNPNPVRLLEAVHLTFDELQVIF